MELIINDLPQHGVLIHGPESPGFKERLLALFVDPPDLDDDGLRCSFIVENQTPQHIHQIMLICRPYPQESEPSFSLDSSLDGGGANNPLLKNLRGWVRGSLIKPGGQCPWSLLEGFGFWKHKVLISEGESRLRDSLRESRDHMKKRLAASDKWSVDINFVIFGDGVFVGPDTDMQFDRLEAHNRASRDLITELNRKLNAGEDVFAYVEQCASEQINAPDPYLRLSELSPDLLQTWRKQSAAKHVTEFWQRSGKQKTVEWIRENAKSPIPLPRRSGPDTTLKDKKIEDWVKAINDFIAELNQKLDAGEDIFAHIERYTSMTREQIEALYPEARTIYRYPEHDYAVMKKLVAMTIIKRRERDSEPAIVEWIREEAKSQVPLVRR